MLSVFGLAHVSAAASDMEGTRWLAMRELIRFMDSR